jgi:hypothetical protein
MNTQDIVLIVSASLVFLLFPLGASIVAFSKKRKDWGIAIIVAILFGLGWLISILFLREFIRTDKAIPKIRELFKSNAILQRVSSFAGGALILLTSLTVLFSLWSRIVKIAESIGRDVAVIIGGIPISGSLFLLLIIFVIFFLAIAWALGLVYFGITGRRMRY